MSAIRPNVIWAMDFQFDSTADGRTFKSLNIIDKFTREALAIDLGRGIYADGVVEVLDHLALQHGAPVYVRFDMAPSSWPTPCTIGADSLLGQLQRPVGLKVDRKTDFYCGAICFKGEFISAKTRSPSASPAVGSLSDLGRASAHRPSQVGCREEVEKLQTRSSCR